MIMRSSGTAILWLTCSFVCGAGHESVAVAEAAIDVGDRRQLLIDRRFVTRDKGITLAMNAPRKAGAVLLPDKPWESQDIGFCVSVIQYEGEYRMWYMARAKEKEEHLRYCFARSKDGITWTKPSLGLIEYRGSKDNNIVLTGVIETTVFLDPIAPPEARFKTVSMMHWPDPKRAGLYIHTSPDGIRWTKSDTRVFPLAPDTANQAFYDTRLKKYVANIRVWAPLRKVGRVEMDDITKPWPFKKLDKPYHIWGKDKVAVSSREVPIVFEYDEHDPPDSDHYNPACVQYPWADDAYFMFPSAYRHLPPPPKGKYHNDGYLDIQMAVSRDGVKWARLSREPYVPLGLQGERDSAQLYMAVGMVRRGDQIFQYYGGYEHRHGEFSKADHSGGIFRTEQRLDGFVSTDAAYEGGEFTTPPLRLSGKQLVLNVNAGAMGRCKVEILDESGKPVSGRALADCDEIGANHVAKRVTWRGEADLSNLCHRPVRLRFVMRACKLYGFQFTP
ncbi:MAG: hypothetical protein JXQ73_33890 [Phycisphaerae bacterium]|nr:hypothetical protein [Phycisphaerae bacterium]